MFMHIHLKGKNILQGVYVIQIKQKNVQRTNPAFNSSIITVDINLRNDAAPEFCGDIFRGFLGHALKFNQDNYCEPDTEDSAYSRIYKADNDIKPYAVLSFKNEDLVTGFLKIHGDRRKYVPSVLSSLYEKEGVYNFNGCKYEIGGIQARTMNEIPEYNLGDSTTVNFITPTALFEKGRLMQLPAFSALVTASLRSFNRTAKKYDPGNYPLHVEDLEFDNYPEILDFDIRTNSILVHSRKNREKKNIVFTGITGSITYDTSGVDPGLGTILKAGEYLQIGKNTTYGFGGFYVASAKA
ncbi:CRISPR system precrRNA processing endoribonuclease RAMP protein Cas6 [Methanolacinia paynteri]|uniref:CRISPR system precrRNA processing endoribonuclease RAMP protein Cas6 n=1 Tax=Methanolacinia paynteri TaxID=230356 RepID=UPI00064FD126|nr:CRISPR system precrRNA processing endoribonuclease RAMP protein Cas6 [Methanolacinia paynteri]